MGKRRSAGPQVTRSANGEWVPPFGWRLVRVFAPDRRRWRPYLVAAILAGALALGVAAPEAGTGLDEAYLLLAAVVVAGIGVACHELLHVVGFMVNRVSPQFARRGSSFCVWGDGQPLSRPRALTILLLPYLVLLPTGAIAVVLLQGAVGWLGLVLIYGQVCGAFFDWYAAFVVVRSAGGTYWADTESALVAVTKPS